MVKNPYFNANDFAKVVDTYAGISNTGYKQFLNNKITKIESSENTLWNKFTDLVYNWTPLHYVMKYFDYKTIDQAVAKRTKVFLNAQDDLVTTSMVHGFTKFNKDVEGAIQKIIPDLKKAFKTTYHNVIFEDNGNLIAQPDELTMVTNKDNNTLPGSGKVDDVLFAKKMINSATKTSRKSLQGAIGRRNELAKFMSN